MIFPIPNILQCRRFIAISPGKQTRIVKDYEFDLYIDGEREMYIDNNFYNISRGCLVFRKPGQTVVGTGDYNMYIMTLDFSKKCPIAPETYTRSSYTPLQEKCELDVLNSIPAVFFPTHLEELAELYKKISNCTHPNPVNVQLQEEYIKEFLFLVLTDACRFNRKITEKSTQTHIQKACNYINKNYYRNISIEDVAENVSLNKNYLIRLFKKELGITPNRHILETRLYQAKLLLIESTVTIDEISYLCGFNTPSYFIKCFKEEYGKTPLSFRNQNAGNTRDGSLCF